MKKLLFAIVTILFLNATKTYAQVSGNNQHNSQQFLTHANINPLDKPLTLNDEEIVITVNGLFNAVPDDFVATFNIVQTAETAETADQLLNERIKEFRQKLRENGADTSNFHVDMISFVPKYEVEAENKLFSKTYNEVPAGFELQKNISIHYKHADELDELISAAANAEIYGLVKVDCYIKNTKNQIDSLRRQCLREVKIRAQSYDIAGIKMDTLKRTLAETLHTIYPETRYFSYQAFSRPSQHFARKKSSPAVYNEITKTISKYYSQLDYDRYDVIINPLVVEPVIQFSCSIAVKYFLHTAIKPADQYYLLMPSGEIKHLNLK